MEVNSYPEARNKLKAIPGRVWEEAEPTMVTGKTGRAEY